MAKNEFEKTECVSRRDYNKKSGPCTYVWDISRTGQCKSLYKRSHNCCYLPGGFTNSHLAMQNTEGQSVNARRKYEGKETIKPRSL